MDKEIKKVLDMKPSAYRSARMSKLKLSEKKDKNNNLNRWFKEKWGNLTATRITDKDKFYNCGTKGKKQKELGLPSVCRPSVKISEKTPKPLSENLTDKQIKKAIKIKEKNKVIIWANL
jgi:hypothetical protein